MHWDYSYDREGEGILTLRLLCKEEKKEEGKTLTNEGEWTPHQRSCSMPMKKINKEEKRKRKKRGPFGKRAKDSRNALSY